MSTPDFAAQLAAFMQAVREQESSGDYNAAGGGAYQFETSTWQSAARAAGVSTSTYPTANAAPPAVQDQVAQSLMTSYYNGPAASDWTKVAEMWNGGQPYPVPNPALGPGATTATYAAEVLQKFEAILNGGGVTSTGTGSGGGTTTEPADLGSLLSIPQDIVAFFDQATTNVVDVARLFAAFFEPSTYVRLGAGLFGIIFLIIGIICLAREAKGM